MEWFLPQLAVTFANEGRPPVPGREDRRADPEPARARPRHLPAVRRVRRRLQLRRQEHARLQLPHVRQAPRRRDPDAGRRAHARAARGRRLSRRVRTARGGRRGIGERAPATVTQLTCDHLILSAGTLGTTNLLLRNRSAFPRLSRKLGTRFCGNGDLLTLAINCAEVTDGAPRAADRRSGLRPGDHDHDADARRARRPRGPRLLPAGRRLPAAPGVDPARAGGAEDAVELALARLLPRAQLAARLTGHRRHAAISPTCSSRPSCRRAACRCSAWVATCRTGACTCGDGRLDVDWKRHSSDAYFDRLRTTSRAVAHSLGGRFADNPIWFLKRRDHRPPARRRPDGPAVGRGRGRLVRERVRLSGPAHRRRLGDARSDRAEPELHDRRARRSLRRQHPRGRPPPRRRPPHDHDRRRHAARERAVHRGDARPHHVRRDRLRPRLGADRPGAGSSSST